MGKAGLVSLLVCELAFGAAALLGEPWCFGFFPIIIGAGVLGGTLLLWWLMGWIIDPPGRTQ
jgi:hypothetical protein